MSVDGHFYYVYVFNGHDTRQILALIVESCDIDLNQYNKSPLLRHVTSRLRTTRLITTYSHLYPQLQKFEDNIKNL